MDGSRAPSRLQSARNSLALDDDGSRCAAVCVTVETMLMMLSQLLSRPAHVQRAPADVLCVWVIRFLEALFAMAPGSPHADSDGAPWPQEQHTSGTWHFLLQKHA
jgi:hypothetical protein